MRITMTQQLSGTRDGADWPAPGVTIDVPDDEAAQLLAQGVATEPTGKEGAGPTETAAAPKRTSSK